MIIETELNCSNISWTEPVRIRIGHGISIGIDGPQSALNAMTQRWPKERGEQYDRARKLCMAALGRRVSASAIRDDFIAACLEAEILVQ